MRAVIRELDRLDSKAARTRVMKHVTAMMEEKEQVEVEAMLKQLEGAEVDPRQESLPGVKT